MAKVLVFDVNETLLDLRGLDAVFLELFGAAAARNEWFTQLLQSAFVCTITGAYTDFGRIGGAVLIAMAERRGIELNDEQKGKLGATMRTLPAHSDVRPALERLRNGGFRMATLTNSTSAVGEAQITNAGLADLFETMLSADAVQRLKPAPEPYLYAAKQMDVHPSELRLVAAHGWDIAGAVRAGCAGGFVARPGRFLDPVSARPDIVGPTLTEVADGILAVDRP